MILKCTINQVDITVSIVTVVYNGEKYIEKTLNSIFSQSYKNYELIIIDGGSKDNTLNIINKYKSNVNYFISEPDQGIYDAMNKSLQYCNGDWVIFMNVGDYFFSNKTLQNIFENQSLSNISVIYGNHYVISNNKIFTKTPRSLNEIWKGMSIQHQSILIKTSILKKLKFDLKYKFAADYNLISNLYYSNYKFHYFDFPISTVTANGYSEQNSILTYLEFKEISLKYNKSFLHKLYFFFLIPYRKIISKIKKII
jgi:glycosyltransferase involved in cell wall biosynthesis